MQVVITALMYFDDVVVVVVDDDYDNWSRNDGDTEGDYRDIN